MVTASQEFHSTHSPLPVQDRSGQSQCFNCIIETFQSQAYNLARRMLSDWALAEDAVQESMVSGFPPIPRRQSQSLADEDRRQHMPGHAAFVKIKAHRASGPSPAR